MTRPRSIALSDPKNSPLSENESGVTFKTPMINPCRETSKARSPIFQILSRIKVETNADARLFEWVAPFQRATFGIVPNTRSRRGQKCSAARQIHRAEGALPSGLALLFLCVASYQ